MNHRWSQITNEGFKYKGYEKIKMWAQYVYKCPMIIW